MSAKPILSLQGIHAGHHGRAVLKGVDLILEPGERIALLGANGAGKSTLLHAILGFLPITAGTITAFGGAVRTPREFQAIRGRIGLVFQDPDDQLFCPTVLDDIAFGPRNLGMADHEARALASGLLEKLDLAHLAERAIHHLSGGEKRLVSVAAVLAMKPEIVLLDEPTAGIDAPSWKRLCALLLELPQAMILVAHDAHFVGRIASRAILIENGKSLSCDVHVHR